MVNGVVLKYKKLSDQDQPNVLIWTVEGHIHRVIIISWFYTHYIF